MKILEYKLCGYYDNPVPLSEEINKLISEGWRPFGSPAVMSTGTKERETVYAQAVVKWGE